MIKDDGEHQKAKASVDHQNSDILTVEDAAELLKIPRSSVYKLAQQGKIPGQKVGRHWRFHRLTLIRWIAGPSLYDEKPGHILEQADPFGDRVRP